MARVELVYFGGCPSIETARGAIRAAGVVSFQELNQDQLPAGHPYKSLSSPSILVDGVLVAGTRAGASACSIMDWKAISDLIAKRVR